MHPYGWNVLGKTCSLKFRFLERSIKIQFNEASSLKIWFIIICSSRIWFIKIGSSKICFIGIGSLETVFRAMSIYPKFNLSFTLSLICGWPVREHYVAPAIINWRYVIVSNLFKSVCLNHIFSLPCLHLCRIHVNFVLALTSYYFRTLLS